MIKLEKSPYSKRDKIISDFNRLTIASAVTPIVLTFFSAYAYILSQQVIMLFVNLGSTIPPILINLNKTKLQKCNDCVELQLKFTGLKGSVNRLASLGQLKDDKLREVDEALKNFRKSLVNYLQISS